MSNDEEAIIKAMKVQAEAKQKANMTETDKKTVKAQAKQDESKQFKLKIYSPYRVYFEDKAESVSAANETGPFDILAGHKNFLTLLSKGAIKIRTTRGEEEMDITRGIMHVKSDQVTVFLDV